MYVSQSQIPESIYQSSRNAKKRDFPKPVQNDQRPNSSKQVVQLYERNIKLQKKLTQMDQDQKRLKQQLSEQVNKNRTLNERELKLLAAGKKAVWDNPKSGPRYPSGNKANDEKTHHLLEIIDHYKNKMVTSEEEIANLKRKNHLLEQDLQLKDKKYNKTMKSYEESSRKSNNEADMVERVKTLTKQLQVQKERSRYHETEVKKLQSKVRALKIKEDEYDQLKLDNRNLEEKLLRLTNLPSFSNVVDRVDDERKVAQVQSKLKLLNQKYTNVRNQKIKVEAEVKLLQNKLIEANYEADTLSKENQKLKAESFSNPILEKLMQNPDLLAKVVYQIEQQKKVDKFEKSQLKRQSYQEILFEKQQLANQLIALRAKMEALQENWKQKERLSKIEKQEMIDMIRQESIQAKQDTKVMSRNGVPYSDDVTMFTQDPSNVGSNSNYFDLYLADVHLLQTAIKSVAHVKNTENLLIITAVDFYNHQTVSSNCQSHQGNAQLKSQFSFSVSEDDFFYKYLNKGNFTISIWGTEGHNKYQLGKATIDLKKIVIKSKPKVAPVISASTPLYHDKKVTGSLNFVMRMRLPIHDQVSRVAQLGPSLDEQAESRRLIIHFEEGRGFGEKANTFVYYPFRLQDHYTKTYKGSNPVWNHYRSLDLKYDTDLKNYLRKNELQITVFDDNVMDNGDGADIVGNGYVSLLPLLENKIIKERLQIMKGNQKVGTVDLRIFWHDPQENSKKQIKTISPSNIHEKILQYLHFNRIEAEDLFRQLDSNRTGMISFSEFQIWVLQICPTASLETINIFYNKFRQPVNLNNFVSKINQKPSVQRESVNELAKQMSMINQFMKKNTTEIKKKQTLEEYLKDKDIFNISLEIDKSRNGIITKQQLQDYFDAHNIEASVDEKQIKIVDFLKRYQHSGR